ncbi:FKBP-type peptidyl-prolyl cis-trans isomerase [Actinosynnema sp. NPDC047251]|uniref:Peptidyl-prolyl cis-trans isomerase n=1 Tax=Saccharothrix espanaensis (strain ATCC 51144 / DSM 44229 / JCM 9112 / NBRC 15066 / NRRL 15764) TaxID=1179773 RepID=K0K7H4_SACES|nr:FKBP-type peptidyl-prolyl cis-trans isomerase [Saccharothrix espanaensis]CCH33502.1 Peptidylprolyl isomerase, FKBP-type [Saccharothrix espanaensis DSM 44229]
MRTVGRTALVLVSLLSAGLALSACTASDRPSTKTNTPSATAPATTEAQAEKLPEPSGPPCEVTQYQVTGEPGAKPTITVPTGCKPQDGLLVKDLTEGTGPEIKAGSNTELHYVLATFRDAKTREASWDNGAPFPLKNIGQAPVIQGWNEGLIGLKEGGRRLLVVPSDKGYPQGKGTIQPGETLIFVIDAIKVEG